MSFIVCNHFEEIDVDAKIFDGLSWRDRWPNFMPYEMCSPDTKAIRLYIPFFDALQRVRTRFGKPMNLTSVYRTPAHNRRVGGSPRSQHLKGRASDCALASVSHGKILERLAREEGMNGIGRYPARRFIHMDMRTGNGATWGRQWP